MATFTPAAKKYFPIDFQIKTLPLNSTEAAALYRAGMKGAKKGESVEIPREIFGKINSLIRLDLSGKSPKVKQYLKRFSVEGCDVRETELNTL